MDGNSSRPEESRKRSIRRENSRDQQGSSPQTEKRKVTITKPEKEVTEKIERGRKKVLRHKSENRNKEEKDESSASGTPGLAPKEKRQKEGRLIDPQVC